MRISKVYDVLAPVYGRVVPSLYGLATSRAAQRLSAVRWGLAGRIVWAWILTIPASAGLGGICYLGLHLVIR